MSNAVWNAPSVSAPISAEVAVPGSKSQTNRALVLAALSSSPSTITYPLISRDTLLMKEALLAFGTEITDSQDTWHIQPNPLRGAGTIECGLAGTVMRFLPLVAALAKGDTTFDGDAQARLRPMHVTLQTLAQLGIDVSHQDRRLPFTVHGTGAVQKSLVEIDASTSSQFVSAILLSGARFNNGVEIHHRGEFLPSLPHIDMSIEMLKKHSVEVQVDYKSATDVKWSIAPTEIQPFNWTIEPDLSNALPFLAGAMVTEGSITIPHWPLASTQPGFRVPLLLQKMGARYRLDETGLTLHGPETINGIEENLSDVGELTPVLVALAALASTPSRFFGISHLRGHETNRLQALSTEISKCGGRIRETADGLEIEPATLHGSVFETYNDHRMVMAGSVLGLKVAGIHIQNPSTVAKTFPEYQATWNQMLGIADAI